MCIFRTAGRTAKVPEPCPDEHYEVPQWLPCRLGSRLFRRCLQRCYFLSPYFYVRHGRSQPILRTSSYRTSPDLFWSLELDQNRNLPSFSKQSLVIFNIREYAGQIFVYVNDSCPGLCNGFGQCLRACRGSGEENSGESAALS